MLIAAAGPTIWVGSWPHVLASLSGVADRFTGSEDVCELNADPEANIQALLRGMVGQSRYQAIPILSCCTSVGAGTTRL